MGAFTEANGLLAPSIGKGFPARVLENQDTLGEDQLLESAKKNCKVSKF